MIQRGSRTSSGRILPVGHPPIYNSIAAGTSQNNSGSKNTDKVSKDILLAHEVQTGDAAPIAAQKEIESENPLMGKGEGASQANPLFGQVMEVVEVADYNYLRMKTSDGERWAAVLKAPVEVGEQRSISVSVVMTDFTSKSLDRTFSSIAFGNLQ